MAITVNSAGNSNGMPTAPQRVTVVNVDLDNSYPTGGYDITASLPDGVTVTWSETVIHYDASALRYLKVTGTGFVQAFVQTDGAPGVEVTAAVDVSGHTGVSIGFTHE
jgi:hypothetical protein